MEERTNSTTPDAWRGLVNEAALRAFLELLPFDARDPFLRALHDMVQTAVASGTATEYAIGAQLKVEDQVLREAFEGIFRR